MTPKQLQLIHIARRQLNLDDADYRLILRNLGGCESSKDLSLQGFEKVMAFFESRGFRQLHADPSYWRTQAQGDGAKTRQLHLARHLYDQYATLAAEHPGRTLYSLPALCSRHSDKRTGEISELSPKELYNLIECLKDLHRRVAELAEKKPQKNSLFADACPEEPTPGRARKTSKPSAPAVSSLQSGTGGPPVSALDESELLTEADLPF